MKYSGDGDSIKPSKDGFGYFLELHHRIPLYDEQSQRNKTSNILYLSGIDRHLHSI